MAEFKNAEQHADYVAALEEELRGADANQTKEIKAELKRVENPGEFQADLDEQTEAADLSRMYAEEHQINPGLTEHPEGLEHDGDKRAARKKAQEDAGE